MSRDGVTTKQRFPRRPNPEGGFLCRICGKPIPGKGSYFCGDPRCERDFMLQFDWKRVRKVIYERDGHRCMKCGKKNLPSDGYHIDHIIPIAAGGDEWDLDNLECSCPECNLKKGAKVPDTDRFKRRTE